jgi:hypothetical protein
VKVASGTVTSAVPYETTSAMAQDGGCAVVAVPSLSDSRGRDSRLRDGTTDLSGPAVLPEKLALPLPPRRAKRQPIVLAESIGPKLLLGKQIAGEKAFAPNDLTKHAIQQGGSQRLKTRFRLCVDETGVVDMVVLLHPSYDNTFLAGIRKWRFSPFTANGEPIPVCTVSEFVYEQYGRPVRVKRQYR